MWAVGKPVPANYTLLEAVDYHAVSQYLLEACLAVPLLEAVDYHAVLQYPLLEAVDYHAVSQYWRTGPLFLQAYILN